MATTAPKHRVMIAGSSASLLALLVAINAGAWGYALIAMHGRPLLIGTAVLAYSLGLRHAVDADHIAAIDNVTRKLMHDGKRTEATGLYFSLGHSSVVFLASLAVAFGALELRRRTEILVLGGLLGTTVSATFLLMIAAANSFVFIRLFRAWRRAQAGQPCSDPEIEGLLAGRGFMTRMLRRVFNLIQTNWHMLPLGFLFGLGFDTASEIGLLAMSATGATHGLSIASILVFPVLFGAGMMLIDTLDSILMTNAYEALTDTSRKLAYNMTITLVSVVVALMISGIEILGLLADKLDLSGRSWEMIAALTNHMGLLGGFVIAMFGACWSLAILVNRIRAERGPASIPVAHVP